MWTGGALAGVSPGSVASGFDGGDHVISSVCVDVVTHVVKCAGCVVTEVVVIRLMRRSRLRPGWFLLD